jgi:RNA-splicing ligase RtcB
MSLKHVPQIETIEQGEKMIKYTAKLFASFYETTEIEPVSLAMKSAESETETQKQKQIQIFASPEKINDQVKKQLDHFERMTCIDSIAIMPDCSPGTSTIVGFSAHITDLKTLCPTIIGQDIGCGVSCHQFDKKKVNFDTLHNLILDIEKRTEAAYYYISSDIFNFTSRFESMCKAIGEKPSTVIKKCCGKIGGGNHFIEMVESKEDDEKYIVVHSGSGFLGAQVYKYHVSKKSAGTFDADEYMSHVEFLQDFAYFNRLFIISEILSHYNLNFRDPIDSMHNYIDLDSMIIRKGAIESKKGNKCIICLNMAKGVIIAEGLSNEEWNFSCAHGCGRICSKGVSDNAKKQLQKEMLTLKQQVYVNHNQLEELPSNYQDDSVVFGLINGVAITNAKQYLTIFNYKMQVF